MVSSLGAQKKVAVALSGGGALGFAHIGVLQALEEEGYEIEAVSGTSMGAIIGVVYAAGYEPQQILEITKQRNLDRLNHLVHLHSWRRHSGMSSTKTLDRVLRRLIEHNSFDSLKIPFVACVTDLQAGEARYISSGDSLVEYVVASAALPGIYDAQVIDNKLYVDGGVTDNLPVAPLKEGGYDFVIGVDVLPFLGSNVDANAVKSALWAIRLFEHNGAKRGLEAADLVITPLVIEKYSEFDFDKYKEIYEIGYQTAKEILKNR